AAYAHSLTEQRIKGQVEQNLAARGLFPASTGQTPDFYITYRIVKQQVVDYYPGCGYGYGYYGGPVCDGYGWGPYPDPYTQDALDLDSVDALTPNLSSRAFASHAIESPESRPKVTGSVDRILKGYPVPLFAGTQRPHG